jgi:hypothetical protein
VRRSILFAALALGAQTAWAQDVSDPVSPDIGVVAEDPMGTDVAIDPGTDVVVDETDPGTDVVVEETDPGTDVVVDETDPGTDVVDDETGPGTDVVVEDETDSDNGVVEEWHDNRSPRGAFRGGHHGTVSTLARAGLGPVFGKLRSQGYGGVDIEQVHGQIFISAERSGEVRHLVYDAATGALVSDVSGPSSGGILGTIASKLKQEFPGHGKMAPTGFRADGRGSGKSKGGEKGPKGGSKGGAKDGSSKGGGGGSKGGGKGSSSKEGGGGSKGNGGGKNK